LYNRGAASVIPFSYTNASGTTNTALSLDPFVGLQTFDLNLAGVTSFSLGQSSTYFQLDNIVFDASTRALAEPSTWAMMMLGFGLVGATMRRRKQRAGLRFAF
jgi:hypothetical protein